MEQSIIFCFTGTGNSLKVAKDIASSLGECGIYDMGQPIPETDFSEYGRIGFVFPVYFLGLPLQVANFIGELSFPPDFSGFIFSIATYANMHGVAVKLVDELLRKQGKRLDYAANIKMGDNAIAFYGSTPNLDRLASSYKKHMNVLIPEIREKAKSSLGAKFLPAVMYYNAVIPGMTSRDKGFQLTGDCSLCGICEKVCPVDNIELSDRKPDFKHGCEQCMACIQLCPEKAIDYKGKCAKRNRYMNPDISIEDLIEFHSIGCMWM